MMVLWKNDCVTLTNMHGPCFPKKNKKKFALNIFQNMPPPPGAATPRGRSRKPQGTLFKICGETRPRIFKMFWKPEMSVFKFYTNLAFPKTIIWAGTQNGRGWEKMNPNFIPGVGRTRKNKWARGPLASSGIGCMCSQLFVFWGPENQFY